MTRQPAARDLRGMSPPEAAAHWLVRHDMGDLSDEECEQFAEWIAHPDHAAAFARARARWDALAGEHDDELVKALRNAALRLPRANRPRWRMAGGVAACLVAALLAFSGGFAFWPARPALKAGIETTGGPDFATTRGERYHVALPDRTQMILNTETEIDVAFGGDERLVRLIRGQAFFDVAPDPARPFVVEVADRRVAARGTAFDVRLASDHLHVVLAEGVVTVNRTPGAGEAEPLHELVLAPGQRLLAEFNGPESVSEIDVVRMLRWREGFVEFRDDTLDMAIAELNRYADRPVVIYDPRVASLRVSGVFRTGQIERFLSVISEVMPVRVDHSEPGHLALMYMERQTAGSAL